MKLLINAPSGKQEIIEVGEGGGYFDLARVLWDDRVDGPLPTITLGGMVRVGAALEYSQARMDEHIAASLPSRDELKAQRQAAVEAITVTVNGKVFDGDETSQERMSRALRVADITGQTSCTWVLHDNTATTVTKDELSQALALAMQAQAAIWVIA